MSVCSVSVSVSISVSVAVLLSVNVSVRIKSVVLVDYVASVSVSVCMSYVFLSMHGSCARLDEVRGELLLAFQKIIQIFTLWDLNYAVDVQVCQLHFVLF